MGKRKELEGVEDSSRNHGNEDEGSGDEDYEMVDVDFEWFDPQPQDFHGLKTLLRQLFDVDNELFDLSELSDLILSQPLLGSTVKTDGSESDPFAFLTVLNLHTHRENEAIRQLTTYLVEKTKESLPNIAELLSPESPAEVGLILTERVINMPAEIVPPMYNMLLEEIQWAVQDKEPYQFTHYLIVSKVYTEVDSTLGQDSRPSKKKRKNDEVFHFHPEDEALLRHALSSATFEYTKQGEEGASDAKRAFQEAGIKPKGSFMLIEASKFETAVTALKEYVGAPA